MLHELHRLPLCPYIRLHHQFIGKMIVSVQIYAHKRKGGGCSHLLHADVFTHVHTLAEACDWDHSAVEGDRLGSTHSL